MKRFLIFLVSRRNILILSFLINVLGIVFLGIHSLILYYVTFCAISYLLFMFFIVVKNYGSRNNFIMSQVILILPLFGYALYVITKTQRGSKRLRVRWRNMLYKNKEFLSQDNNVCEDLKKIGNGEVKTSRYIFNTLRSPIYENCVVKYFSNGEGYFEDLQKELKGAKEYILIECANIYNGHFWEKIFTILKDKSFQGVEIKLLFDDYNSVRSFKDKLAFSKLNNHGIQTRCFNKVKISIPSFVSHRLNSNTIIIDGEIAYSSQVDMDDSFLSSEENSLPVKGGTIKMMGESVCSNIVMFFNNWNLFYKQDKIDVNKYIKKNNIKQKQKLFVQPYEITPFSSEQVTKNIAICNMFSAQESIWIATPYILIGNEMKNALKICARSGVDVNLVVSETTNKYWKKVLSTTNYIELIREGVKIYVYGKSELRSKAMVIDGKNALIGGGNIDCRKMHSHFENGVLIHDNKTSLEIKKSINELMNESVSVTIKDLTRGRIFFRFYGAILKVLSPLM